MKGAADRKRGLLPALHAGRRKLNEARNGLYPCVIYSFGSNMNSHFEDTLAGPKAFQHVDVLSTSSRTPPQDQQSSPTRTNDRSLLPGQRCQVHIYDPTLRSAVMRGSKEDGAGVVEADDWMQTLPGNYFVHEVGLVEPAGSSGVGGGTPATRRRLDQTERDARQDYRKDLGLDGGLPWPAFGLMEILHSNGHLGEDPTHEDGGDEQHDDQHRGATNTQKSLIKTSIDVIKIDIESHEHSVLEHADFSKIRVGNLLLELHANKIDDRLIATGKSGEDRYLMKHVFRHFVKLEKAGYRLFSSEPVCSGCASSTELSFVHRDWAPECGFAGCGVCSGPGGADVHWPALPGDIPMFGTRPVGS